MIIVRNLRLGIDETEDILTQRALRKLKIGPESLVSAKLSKRSLDARKKNDIHYNCALLLSVKGDEARLVERARSADVALWEPKGYDLPAVKSESRPVVVGFGPAGMFAALVLSMAGARPIVIERGAAVESGQRRWSDFVPPDSLTRSAPSSSARGVPAPSPTVS